MVLKKEEIFRYPQNERGMSLDFHPLDIPRSNHQLLQVQYIRPTRTPQHSGELRHGKPLMFNLQCDISRIDPIAALNISTAD